MFSRSDFDCDRSVFSTNPAGTVTGGSWAGVMSKLSDDPEATYYLLALLAYMGQRSPFETDEGYKEGVISSCAIKALGGAMLARLAPQSQGASTTYTIPVTQAGSASTQRIVSF